MCPILSYQNIATLTPVYITIGNTIVLSIPLRYILAGDTFKKNGRRM